MDKKTPAADNGFEELKKLQKQGIHPYYGSPFFISKNPQVGVRIEVMIPKESDPVIFDFNVECVMARGATVTLSDFKTHDRGEDSKVFSFIASMRIPDNVMLPPRSEVVMSYQDFCWYQGHEATKPDLVPDTTTVVVGPAVYNDIGWYLPCRFADRLLEALGMANDFLFQGVLENALIYGMMVNGGKE